LPPPWLRHCACGIISFSGGMNTNLLYYDRYTFFPVINSKTNLDSKYLLWFQYQKRTIRHLEDFWLCSGFSWFFFYIKPKENQKIQCLMCLPCIITCHNILFRQIIYSIIKLPWCFWLILMVDNQSNPSR
jgi:hypothetical protein